MLTSKQRAYLRGMANQMNCIFQIGKGGVTEELSFQISNALEARELIKVKILDNCDLDVTVVGEALAQETGADVVGTVGNRVILYRESKKKKRIELNV